MRRKYVATAPLERYGCLGLVVLAAALPFELTQRPLIHTRLVTLTNLKLVLYVVTGIGVATLIRFGLEPARRIAIRRSFRAVRLPLGLLAALLICSLLSSIGASTPAGRDNSLKWTLDSVVGALLWLVMPLWLASARRKISLIPQAIVAGATVAAGIGILEFALGAGYAGSLSGFKAKPTLAGSFLRLSGTFEYANIAAMYFELALPLAIAGLVIAAGRQRPQWASVLGWLVAAVLLFEGILLTFSRGALLGVASSAAVAAALSYRSRERFSTRPLQVRMLTALVVLFTSACCITLIATPLALLRLTSPSDQQWYLATYSSRLPSALQVCQRLALPVVIVNKSPFVWQASGKNVYNLGYHWLYATGKVAQFENPRTSLPDPVQPGSTVRVQARIQAPPQPGRYALVWDMVQENVTWFSLKSASYVGNPVLVLGSSAAKASCNAAPERTQITSAAGPAALPRVISEPSRLNLWKAAWSMIRAHPLLGVGPDNYRLQYGMYMRPPLANWDTRILANELYLEILADLGVLGAGIYFAFLGTVWWPLIAAGWFRMDVAPSAWHVGLVAAFAAFLGHGLVDDFLDSHAVSLAFWLLCGLATTSAAELTIDERRRSGMVSRGAIAVPSPPDRRVEPESRLRVR